MQFGRQEENQFLNVIDKRYENGNVILTNHSPFSRWSCAFADNGGDI
ncbi:hypothetical protein CK910_06800 [Aeromonas sp. CA23]|nr:hypothetical protein CK910_06800 [Aeromonas sp. CA23]